MINLAGKNDCDTTIRRELERSRIPIVTGDRHQSEVPYSLTGQLNGFTFRRAWYYWVVEGLVPLEIAVVLYADPVGRTDIRVCGHCGCPDPVEYGTVWLDSDNIRLLPLDQRDEFERYLASNREGMKESAKRVLAANRFVADPSAHGRGFVDGYHIDSEVGLRIFTDAIRDTHAARVTK